MLELSGGERTWKSEGKERGNESRREVYRWRKRTSTSLDVNKTLSDRIEWICRSVCNATAWFLLTTDGKNWGLQISLRGWDCCLWRRLATAVPEHVQPNLAQAFQTFRQGRWPVPMTSLPWCPGLGLLPIPGGLGGGRPELITGNWDSWGWLMRSEQTTGSSISCPFRADLWLTAG